MANISYLWKGGVEPAESSPSGNEYRAWKGAVEPVGAASGAALRHNDTSLQHNDETLRHNDGTLRHKDTTLRHLRTAAAAPAAPAGQTVFAGSLWADLWADGFWS